MDERASAAFDRDVRGFGASYNRQDDEWVIYSMPGTIPFARVEGYHREKLDWIIGALRAALQPTGDNDG